MGKLTYAWVDALAHRANSPSGLYVVPKSSPPSGDLTTASPNAAEV